MKKRNLSLSRLLLITVCGILAVLVAGFVWIRVKSPAYSTPDTSAWHTGQIFFSVGDSWKSDIVRTLTGVRVSELTDSTPSHCGMVLRRGSELFLVHESTDAEKIVAETPSEYITKNGAYAIYALAAPCPVDSTRLVAVIDSLLDVEAPFDFNFDHSDRSALYCSELVVYLLEKTSAFRADDLLKLKYIYPQDIKALCQPIQ